MKEWAAMLFDLSTAASLTVLVVLAFRLLFYPLSKKYFYLLWMTVFVWAVCPISYSLPFSVFNLFSFMGVKDGQLTAVLTPGQTIRLAGILGKEEAVAAGTDGRFWAAAINAADGGARAAESAAGPDGLIASLPDGFILKAAGCIWAAGVLLLLLWGIFSWVRLRWRLSAAVETEDGVFETDQISTGLVLGFLRPSIYLPAGLSGEKRDYVICHERIHIRRWDQVLKMLAWLAAVLHWFNPLLWLALALLERDMEISCDECVLDEIGGEQKENYGEFLLTLAASAGFSPGRMPYFGKSSVKARIRSILGYKKKRKAWAAAAEITYPGLTSDGNWWVWKDYITLEQEEESWLVTDWERKEFFSIASLEDFREAYKDWMPDYLNGAIGDSSPADEFVCRDLAGQDPEYYEETFYTPEAALAWAFHLEGGTAEVKEEGEGRAVVEYHFPDGSIEVQLVQPGLEEGSRIWLPQTVEF